LAEEDGASYAGRAFPVSLEQLQRLFPFRLDAFQAKAVQQLLSGKSVVVCAPTGVLRVCVCEATLPRPASAAAAAAGMCRPLPHLCVPPHTQQHTTRHNTPQHTAHRTPQHTTTHHATHNVTQRHTGAGKTAIAEAAAAATLARGQRVIYTTPLKALSNQKLAETAARFGSSRCAAARVCVCVCVAGGVRCVARVWVLWL
jgi:hypothetical protein